MRVSGSPRRPGDAIVTGVVSVYAHLEAQGGLLAMARRSELGSIIGGGKRGIVTTFSRSSRLRMLRKVARLEAKTGVFVTLTYPARHPDAHDAKTHLRALLERFRRKYPTASAFWRYEPQKRGAPHFHLIFYDLPFVPFHLLRQWWSQIIKNYVDEWQPRVRIEWIRSRNGVMYYTAKYCAKSEPVEVENSVGCPVSLSTTHICTFLGMARLAQTVWAKAMAFALRMIILDRARHVGRAWGVFNKEFLPYAPKNYAIIEQITPLAFEAAKIAMREIYPNVSKNPKRGAAIFTAKAYVYHGHLLDVLLADAPQSEGGFWIGVRPDGKARPDEIRQRTQHKIRGRIRVYAAACIRWANTTGYDRTNIR